MPNLITNSHGLIVEDRRRRRNALTINDIPNFDSSKTPACPPRENLENLMRLLSKGKQRTSVLEADAFKDVPIQKKMFGNYSGNVIDLYKGYRL